MRPSVVKAIAQNLDIFDRQKKSISKWRFYPEQERLLTEMLKAENERIIIHKIRQIGISLLCCFRAAIFDTTNPGIPIAFLAQDGPTA